MGKVLALTMVAGTLWAGSTALAEKDRAPDRPDGAVPLLELPPAVPPSAGSDLPGTPAPRAQDSTRTPMPDRDALPKDLQDARLAPPTPPVPQNSGAKTGGGPSRVKQIFSKPPEAGALDPRRTP